jgi:integrase
MCICPTRTCGQSLPPRLSDTLLVLTLVGLGLRISEACGLLVSDVDFLGKIVHVRRPGGELGKLKTESSGRDIPADDWCSRRSPSRCADGDEGTDACSQA